MTSDEPTSLRLEAVPEFSLRLQELLAFRGLKEKPVLVLQARPSVALKLDLHDPRLGRTLRGGLADDNRTWEGFTSVVRPTFHGRGTQGHSWCFEAHRDGHFIAANWDFPMFNREAGEVPVIPDYNVEFIRDAFAHVESVCREIELKATFNVTATLVNANQLAYLAYTSGYKHRIAAEPLLVKTLQWPITSGEVGSQQWNALALAMGEGLCGAYGHASYLSPY